jgi:hypothetical protein
MNGDDRDPLWELLGQARQAEASPFFARNVVRDVRSAGQNRAGFFRWLHRSWRIAIPALAAAAVVVLSSGMLQHPTPAAPNPVTAQIVRNPDYDVINHLDELVATEENALWLENSVN